MTANFLYIDPGTGSMLFSLAVGIMTALVFAVRAAAVKIRFVISGGRAARVSAGKIPFVIFSDHRRYWNVFKPVCDEFERRGIPLVYYTQSPDDPALCEKYEFVRAEFIGEGNRGLVRMNMLNAGVVLSTTPGLGVLQWKRSRNVDWYVHIPHAVDEMGDYKMFGIDHYDALLATGQNQIDFAKKIEQVRDGIPRKQYTIVGATFMDVAYARIKNLETHKPNAEKPVVLLAPSWGEKSVLNIYGEKLLDALKETGFKITVRPHPQSFIVEREMLDKLMLKYSDFEWNHDNDNLAALNSSDVLITDFSGIIFDWALLFDKPLIFAEARFNTDTFDAAWIEGDLWRFTAAEKIGVKLCESQFPNLRNVILDSFSDKEKIKNRIDVQSECWQNRGNAAKAVVDFMVERNTQMLKVTQCGTEEESCRQ